MKDTTKLGELQSGAVADPSHAWKLSGRDTGDPVTAQGANGPGPHREGISQKPVMHGDGKSDTPIVPKKLPNKTGRAVAEAREGRGVAKGNTTSKTHPGRRAGSDAQSALGRVREAARRDKNAKFTALFHHITIDKLREAYWALSRKAAPGIDGITWKQYGEGLEARLADLYARLQRGAYRATASRRVYIPKADGRMRPLGIAALEDKVLQRTVVEVLNGIYEVDFIGFSYGFRPGRSPHDALDALTTGLVRRRVNWVLDADIRGYFDNIDHGWLMKFLEHRIGDKKVLRLIEKWLSAGAMEEGKWIKGEQGSPQGATISPLLANVYLHYVLDLWVQQWRRRHARGMVTIVRYADDAVFGFEYESDARSFQRELGARMLKFKLELNEEKTKLIEFGRFATERRQLRGLGRPKTFDFLGFTHTCAKLGTGKYAVKRTTIRKRMRDKLRKVKEALKQIQHEPISKQGRWLGSVVRGHNAYYAVPTNIRAIAGFRKQVERHWLRSLRRRGQRDRTNWARMRRLSEIYLPKPQILHPWPLNRFDARTQGRSPVR